MGTQTQNRTDEQIAASVPGVTAEQVAEVRAFAATICPTCQGGGTVMVQAGPPDMFGNIDADEHECEDCGGMGRR